MRRFRSRRFAMLLILMLTLSMALQGVATVSFADPEEITPPVEEPVVEEAEEAPPTEAPVIEEEPATEAPPTEAPPAEEPVIEEEPAADEPDVLGIDILTAPTDYSKIVQNDVEEEACNEIKVEFKNVGASGDHSNENMLSDSTWELYWIASGDPTGGAVIASGTFGKLNKYSDRDLSFNPYNNPNGPNGHYKFKVNQSNLSESPAWSSMLDINGCPLPHLSITNGTVDKPMAWPGETVQFTFTVHNDGNVDLDSVNVKDSLPGNPKTSPGNQQFIDMDGTDYNDSGDVKNFVNSYTLPNDASGVISNPAHAEGIWERSGPDMTVLSNTVEPQVTIKTVGITLDKSADKSEAFAGETVLYSFTVTNTGNIPLYNIQLNDGDIGHTDTLGELAGGDSYTFTKEYIVPCSLENSGPAVNTMQFVNTATVIGYVNQVEIDCAPPQFTPPESVTATDTFTLTLKQSNPSIQIYKDVSLFSEASLKALGSNQSDDCLIVERDQENVYYTFHVYNSGDIPLHNVVITDPLFDSDTEAVSVQDGAFSLNVGTLNPGEWWHSDSIPFSLEGMGFRLINTATVTGDTYCNQVSDTDSACVGLADIQIEKQVQALDAEGNPVGSPIDELFVGSPDAGVRYTFTVTNLGSEDLYGVMVTDPMFDGMEGWPKSIGTLPAGDSDGNPYTFTFDYSFDQEGEFNILNTAQVVGSYDCGYRIGTTELPSCTVEDSDSAAVIYQIPYEPAVQIDKSVDTSSIRSGRTVNYTLTVTNIGNVHLYQLVVSDPLLDFSQTIESLAPGASVTLPAIPKTLTTGDRNSGSDFVNTASVTGNTCPPITEVTPSFVQDQECMIVSDSDDATVTITRRTGGGGGGTTTITPEATPEAVPEVVPEPAPVVEPAPAPAPAPVIVEEVIPLGVPVLPKTAELPVELFYGLGGMLTALGAYLKRR